MEEMLDDLKEYFKNTPQDIIDKDMEELDAYNTGPDIILEPFNNKGCLECSCYKHSFGSNEHSCNKGYNVECNKWWDENGKLKYNIISPMHCYEKSKSEIMLDSMNSKCDEILNKI